MICPQKLLNLVFAVSGCVVLGWSLGPAVGAGAFLVAFALLPTKV